MRKLIILQLVLLGFITFSNVTLAGSWGGLGTISRLYIYPSYAVVVQNVAPTPGPAGCTNNSTFSFNWSDFDLPTQNRIMSTLLSAYAAKIPVVVIYGDVCGPEGHKVFTGHIQLGE